MLPAMEGQLFDVYAFVGAVSLGTLALLYGVVWRNRRERWSASLGLCFVVLAVIYGFDRWTRPLADQPHPAATPLAALAAVLLVDGMVDYVGLEGRVARWGRVAAVVLAPVVVAGSLLGLLTRMQSFSLLALYLAAVGAMAFWATLREPRVGHALVLAATSLFPLLTAAAALGQFPVGSLRYLAIVPTLVTGMTLLTTGLLRAQRRADEALRDAAAAQASLRALNESLEQRVEARTCELRDMVAALEGFNRQVSHDLRGPLGGIAGAARMADQAFRRGDAAAAGRLLPAIASQAETSMQLMAALLQLARAGNAPLEMKAVAQEPLVREALEELWRGDQALARIAVSVEGPLPEVQGDPALLRQVWVNLLGNAMKFSRQSPSPRVEVGAEASGDALAFFVRDNGVGFADAVAPKLFEPFQRLHGSAYAGHGLGLSIVKRIVQRHGGRIWAESAEGRGATFYFTLGERQAA